MDRLRSISSGRVVTDGTSKKMIPGQLVLRKEDIKCNVNRRHITIEVKNTGDRPIQVGSHYHFFETNKKLQFDRAKAFGMRLNIPSSTAIRLEPGESKKVNLIELGGNKKVFGHNNLTNGGTTETEREQAFTRAREKGFM